MPQPPGAPRDASVAPRHVSSRLNPHCAGLPRMYEDDVSGERIYQSSMSLPPLGEQQRPKSPGNFQPPSMWDQSATTPMSPLKPSKPSSVDTGPPGPVFASSALDLLNSQPMLGGPPAKMPGMSAWDDSAVRPLRPVAGGPRRHRSVSRSVSRSRSPQPRPWVEAPALMQQQPMWMPMQQQVEMVEIPQRLHIIPQPPEQVLLPAPVQVVQPAPLQVVQTEPVQVVEMELRRDLRNDAMREYGEIRRQQQQELTEQLARMSAHIERFVSESMAQVRVVPNERVVLNEVPVEVIKVVKEEVPRVIEEVRYIDRVVEVGVEKLITKEVPIYVDRIVQHEVPMPFDKVVVKEVPVAYEVERVIEKIVEKEIPVYIEQIVMREVPVPVEKIIWKEVEVPVEKIVQVPVVEIKVVEVIREVPVESVRIEKIETFIDRPVVTVVTVERVVEKEVPVRIETIKEVIVEKEVPIYVEKVVTKHEIVYVDRIIEKPIVKTIEKEVIVEKIVTKEVEKVVFKEVPVEVQKIVIKEVPVEVEKIVYRDREVEKIVYRDREPPEDEGPIKLAKEIKKVQRSAAPGVQRSAAPPPQKSGIIEDTFPLVEFTAAPPQKSGIIEDTFPLAEFNQRSAVPRAQRSAAPLPQKKAAAEEIEDTFPLVEFNQRSAAPRAQRSAAPPPQKKEAVTSSQVQQVQVQSASWTNSSSQAATSITEQEIMAVRREIERAVDVRFVAEQEPSRVVQSQSSVPISHSSASVQGGETVRKHGLSVPITPARDHVRKVGVGLILDLNAAGEIIVTDILPGFGAIKSGMIGLKDVLLQIDDTPVAAMSLEELNARTVGAEGTSCKLKLHKSLGGSTFDVNLVRSVPRNRTQEHTYSTQELEELSEELSDSTAFDSESSAPSTSRSLAPSTSRSSSLAHARDQAFSPMRAMPQAAHQRQHRSARELLTPTFSDQGPLVSSGGAKDSERA